MDQLKRVMLHGLAFLQLPDGSLFPVLQGGDDGPDVPPPDPGLTRRQNELLDMQLDNARRSKLLEPVLLERAGLRLNPNTGLYEDSDPGTTQMKRDIERMQLERSQKALKGELPISKTLQREFEMGQQRLDEKLNRQGGPGAKNSTSGVLQQEAFDRNRIALQEAEQRDMLTTAEALALNRQNSRSTEAAQIENPFASRARMLAPAESSVRSAREQDNFNRNLQYQSNLAGQQNMAGYISGGMGLLGMGGAAAIMSDPEVKYDIEPVSDAELLADILKMPVSRWKYKHDGSEHIGAMADKMPRTVSDGKTFDLVSYLGLITGGIREIARRQQELEEDRLTPGMALAF